MEIQKLPPTPPPQKKKLSRAWNSGLKTVCIEQREAAPCSSASELPTSTLPPLPQSENQGRGYDLEMLFFWGAGGGGGGGEQTAGE